MRTRGVEPIALCLSTGPARRRTTDKAGGVGEARDAVPCPSRDPSSFPLPPPPSFQCANPTPPARGSEGPALVGSPAGRSPDPFRPAAAPQDGLVQLVSRVAATRPYPLRTPNSASSTRDRSVLLRRQKDAASPSGGGRWSAPGSEPSLRSYEATRALSRPRQLAKSGRRGPAGGSDCESSPGPTCRAGAAPACPRAARRAWVRAPAARRPRAAELISQRGAGRRLLAGATCRLPPRAERARPVRGYQGSRALRAGPHDALGGLAVAHARAPVECGRTGQATRRGRSAEGVAGGTS